MPYVVWSSTKRIHEVSLTRSGGGISFDPVTQKIVSNGERLTTKCGVAIPDEHRAIESLTIDELNNEVCNTCWRTESW